MGVSSLVDVMPKIIDIFALFEIEGRNSFIFMPRFGNFDS